MKALNPSTGNLEEIYVKALDSMPIGSTVEYSGSSADIPAGWEEVNDYSTTEVNTGKKWIDGKTIYRKAFNITSPSTDTTTKVCEITGSSVINYWGYIEGNYSARYPLNFYVASNDFIYSYIADGNGINLRAGHSGYRSKPLVIVLEYTKTTD